MSRTRIPEQDGSSWPVAMAKTRDVTEPHRAINK